jgi:subtilisin family serine protease
VASVPKSPYVVTLNPGSKTSDFVSSVRATSNEYLLKTLVNSKSQSVQEVLVIDLSADQLLVASSSSMISSIIKEGVISTSATQSGATWGLDRIDQFTKTGDGNYNYSFDGTGVDVYVIDSGIRLDHSEFTGRITAAYRLSEFTSVEDCTGHGTHVAAIAAGTTYGVAKKANIIPIRIFNCEGKATLSGMQVTVSFINSIHESTTPAVANLSLGFGYNSTMNSLMQSLINDGIVTVVAAGNDGADACNYSPASAPNAITVAASTSIDRDATFSNIGACVDIFAPGDLILSAGFSSVGDFSAEVSVGGIVSDASVSAAASPVSPSSLSLDCKNLIAGSLPSSSICLNL